VEGGEGGGDFAQGQRGGPMGRAPPGGWGVDTEDLLDGEEGEKGALCGVCVVKL